MSGKDLDALAKGLAEERVSRGTALKRLGAALLGGSLFAAFPGAALAQPECGPTRPCPPRPGCTARCVNASGGKTCVYTCEGCAGFQQPCQTNADCCPGFRCGGGGKCLKAN
jgi:hypothetical protein